MQRRVFLLASAAGVTAGSAWSQNYPSRAVKLINPFPPGSPVDLVARPLSERLQAVWNQPVIVENKAGAGGTLGADLVAKAAPDGYTLLVTSASTHVIAPVLRKSMPYDVAKDFTPLALVAHGPTAIVVHPGVPVRSLAELVQYARANPGKIAYASSGPGTILHLNGELFASRTGTELLHVPYKGAVPASTDLLAGQVQMMFDSIANSAPQVKAGKLRALAVLMPTRSPLLPDVPTAAEQGFAGLEFPAWIGVFGPPAMPRELTAQAIQALQQVTAQAEIRERFMQNGLLPAFIAGAELAAKVAADQKVVGELVRQARIELQ